MVIKRIWAFLVSNDIFLCKLFTLSLIPKSSRIPANTIAKLKPECKHRTSRRSKSIEIGTPVFSKCTVTATYSLWFGEVHASVVKFIEPLCSCVCIRSKFFFITKHLLHYWPVTSSQYAYECSQTHSWHHKRQFSGKEYDIPVSLFSWDSENPSLSLFERVIYSLQPNGWFWPYKHTG